MVPTSGFRVYKLGSKAPCSAFGVKAAKLIREYSQKGMRVEALPNLKVGWRTKNMRMNRIFLRYRYFTQKEIHKLRNHSVAVSLQICHKA